MIIEFEKIQETKNPMETEALAERLGKTLKGGEVLALIGELGSGKTTFIRGLARGLGVEDSQAVKSPSYTLVLRYPGPISLLHLDAYFMRSLEDLDLCGMEDALYRGEVVALEWGEKVWERLPDHTLVIEIHHLAWDRRRIQISPLKEITGKRGEGKQSLGGESRGKNRIE